MVFMPVVNLTGAWPLSSSNSEPISHSDVLVMPFFVLLNSSFLDTRSNDGEYGGGLDITDGLMSEVADVDLDDIADEGPLEIT